MPCILPLRTINRSPDDSFRRLQLYNFVLYSWARMYKRNNSNLPNESLHDLNWVHGNKDVNTLAESVC